MRRPPARCAISVSIAGALFAAAQVASADVATADKLFNEGKALMAEGKIAAACAKYEASYDADPALGSLLNHADCLERDGRLATAYGRWGDAVAVATRKGDDRADYARERREALKPKLSFLTLTVKGALPPDMFVFKGDTKLSAGAFGTALPTDPGETVIQVVRGQDEVLWETKVQLAEAQQQTVVVPLEEIVKQNPSAMKKRQTTEEGGRRTQTEGPSEIEGFWSRQRIAGFVIGGVGVLGAGAGFALGGLAASKSSDLDRECTQTDPRYCTTAGEEIRQDAYTLATASTWTLIGSGIVAAVGITVIVTAPSEYAKLEERAFLVPWLSPEGGGLIAKGTF
ncbi:MAG: hypothetical protein HOW73_31030 [Polyangiaceae bacterium]|nr:hypothetical protein [Polyangiaceae bacterium]